MKTGGAVGIPTVLILITSLFIAGTIAKALLDNPMTYPPNNPQDIVMEAVDEISTYLEIQDIVGLYSSTTADAHLTRIVLLISPFFSQSIDLRSLTIQLNDGEHLHMLVYNEQVQSLADHGVFTHPLWDALPAYTFGCISTHDKDQSMTFHTLNAQTDMAYLLLPLPSSYDVQKDTMLEITIFPGTGVQRSVVVHAPLPMRNVVSLR